MERIVSANPRSGYRLRLKFTDGAEGEVSLAHLVGKGVYSGWKDPAEFAMVSIDPRARTVCWPGGIDLDPDALYSKVTGKSLPGATEAA